MRPKDNVLAAIRLEKPSRIPAVLFSGGAWTFNNRGLTLEQAVDKAELMAQVIVETNAGVGSDIVWAGSGYQQPTGPGAWRPCKMAGQGDHERSGAPAQNNERRR